MTKLESRKAWNNFHSWCWNNVRINNNLPETCVGLPPSWVNNEIEKQLKEVRGYIHENSVEFCDDKHLTAFLLRFS